MSVEDVFQSIADKAIRDAERVRCSLADFADGMKTIELAIRERRELADDEAKPRETRGDRKR